MQYPVDKIAMISLNIAIYINNLLLKERFKMHLADPASLAAIGWSLVGVALPIIIVQERRRTRELQSLRKELKDFEGEYILTVLDNVWFPLQQFLQETIPQEYENLTFIPSNSDYVKRKFSSDLRLPQGVKPSAELLMALKTNVGGRDFDISFDLDARWPSYVIARILPPTGGRYYKIVPLIAFDRSDIAEFIRKILEIYDVKRAAA